MYDQLLANLAILVLSGFVGFSVISKVPNTLHTPLMSGTNAIHGIVLVGALVVLGRVEQPSLAIQIILFVAVVFGTLNVVGGFVVTDRMLGMFKGKKPAPVKVSAESGVGGAVHLRLDGFDRAQDRGARQLDRRRGYGGGGDGHPDLDSPYRQLGADHRGSAGRCGAGGAPGAAGQDDGD